VRGFGYGSIRNYIEAINVVLPTGEVLEIKRGAIFSKQRVFDCVCSKKKLKFKLPSYVAPKIKSQAGYFVNDNMDLIDLFIGSEGTLGVITSCKLRLQDKPQGIFDGLIFFKEEAQGLAFITEVKELKDKKALFTASLEFFDKNSIEMLRKEYPFMPRAACAVYFEQITHLKEKAPDLLKIWLSLIDNYKTFSDYNLLADTASERKKVFEIRHRVPQLINEFLREHKQIKASLDCAVPSDSMVEMYNFYKEKAEESKISYVNFGHIGEAHLHFNFLPKNEDESIRAKKYIEIFCKKAVSLGGTISAEHGIGKLKKPYLKIMYGADKIEEMAALKKYFDPDCLLGLDNLFDKEVLSKI
jgi:D-lactate dehydrogenase (cytochrome)